MGRKLKKLAKRSGKAVKRASRKAETEVLAAIGRQTVRAGTRKAVKASKEFGKSVAGEMVKKAALAGAVAAAGVAIRAIRRKRLERKLKSV